MPAYDPRLRNELEGLVVQGASVVRRVSQGCFDEFDLDDFSWYSTGVRKALWKTIPHP